MNDSEKIEIFTNSGALLREDDHVYILSDGTEITKSVTGIVESQFPYFDKEKIAKNLTRRVPKYQHLTWDELLEEWDDARNHGKLVHAEMDSYIKENLEPNEEKAIAGREWFDKNISNYGDRFFSEIVVYSKICRLAGTIDLLVYNSKTGECFIFDWKTSKKIDYTGKKKGITDDTEDIIDCNYNKYSLQLCFYKYLLFYEFGISSQGEYIVHLKDDSVDIHEAADYYSTAEKISNGRRYLVDLYGKKAVKKWHKGVKKYADGLGPVIKDLQKILTYKNMELLGFDPKDHEKVCPDCFENIKLPAVICIYCKRKFSSDEVDVAIDKLFSELYDEPRYTED